MFGCHNLDALDAALDEVNELPDIPDDSTIAFYEKEILIYGRKIECALREAGYEDGTGDCKLNTFTPIFTPFDEKNMLFCAIICHDMPDRNDAKRQISRKIKENQHDKSIICLPRQDTYL